MYVDLTITVTGKSKSTQARVSLSPDIFELFSCESNENTDQNTGNEEAPSLSITFVVQLQVLLGCLSLHGHGQSSESTVASLYYSVSQLYICLLIDRSSIYFHIMHTRDS